LHAWIIVVYTLLSALTTLTLLFAGQERRWTRSCDETSPQETAAAEVVSWDWEWCCEAFYTVAQKAKPLWLLSV